MSILSRSRSNEATAFGYLSSYSLTNLSTVLLSDLLRLGLEDLVELALRSGLKPLWQLVEHVRRAMHPAALLLALGPDLSKRCPEAQGTVADGQQWRLDATSGQVAEHREPALLALAIAILHGDQLLAAIFAHTDQNQRAQTLVFKANAEVNAVGPDVREALRSDVALANAVAIVLTAPTASATTMRLASLEELVQLSRVIVVARTDSSETLWRGTRIYTRYSVTVEESWMGALLPGQRLEVLTLGGVVGEIGQHVAGAARLPVGQRSVLYLVADDQGAYHPVGMWQGVFGISPDDAAPTVARAESGNIVNQTGVSFPTDLAALKRSVLETRTNRAP